MLWQLDETKNRVVDIRRLSDMKELVFDKGWLENNWAQKSTAPVYYIYRNIFKKEDASRIKQSGLRYNITVVPGQMLGEEYTKTFGHYNPIAVDEYSFPEVYQVLEGEAIFLIQKVDNFNQNNIQDVAFAKGRVGEVFVVPPNYGHIIINPSPKRRLVLASWVADGFTSIYEPIKRLCGGSYFFTKDGWVKNHRYGLVPDIRQIKCKKLDDIYGFAADLEKLAFLKDPSIRLSGSGVQ
ncbi:MAG: glucose-6-phosphate isomerase [Candidatus Aenigmarchaeota archaeon]|nr:glucose-6-phosphate isomerase [Candidatus Aenigmarchaeota archaeon]